MEKKFAGWFVEGAPILFPSLEDATVWRQTQIWGDGGIGMTPMPESVIKENAMTGYISVGRAQHKWGEYYGPVRITLRRDDVGVIWLMDVPPIQDEIVAGVEETSVYARKVNVEIRGVVCYKPELLEAENKIL